MAPFDFTDCVRYVKSWDLPRPIIGLFKFIICYPIVFHSLNGVRFIGFDMAKFVGTQVSGALFLPFALAFIHTFVQAVQRPSTAARTLYSSPPLLSAFTSPG